MNQSNRTELDQLMGYLQVDPENPALLEDTAHAAAACHDLAITRTMIERLKALGPLSQSMRALEGSLLMGAGQFDKAVELYRSLLEQLPQDTSVKCSLAWALVQVGQSEAALHHLDKETVFALPQAAELRLKLLHSSGDFEQAGTELNDLVSAHPNHAGLLAAASVLAIDLEDLELARELALSAGDEADAHTTLGLLSLDRADPKSAELQFDRALQQKPDLARAWIGKGLVALAQNSPDQAIVPFSRGAELFRDHLGSWIALGWSELLSGDIERAERTFFHALSLDRTFAESHGSVAVIEVLRGNLEAARTAIETSKRLDSQSFSAVFASILLASQNDRDEVAHRMFERTLDAPFLSTGKTLRDMISEFARKSH